MLQQMCRIMFVELQILGYIEFQRNFSSLANCCVTANLTLILVEPLQDIPIARMNLRSKIFFSFFGCMQSLPPYIYIALKSCQAGLGFYAAWAQPETELEISFKILV